MVFEAECETCGAKVRIEEDSRGDAARCRECGAGVSVRRGDDENPYASPAGAAGVAGESEGDTSAISAGARRALLQTRPWVFVVSAFGFAFTGILVVVTGFVLFSAIRLGNVYLLMGTVVYLLVAVFYFGLSYLLFRYGRRIGALRRTGSLGEFEAAVIAQNMFWRFLGIGAVAWLVFAAWAFLVAPWFE